MSKLTYVLPIALLLLLAAPAAAQIPGTGFGGGAGADSEERVSAEISWRERKITAGMRATLGIVLEISPRWHIQAGQGSGDEQPPYIATTIELDLPPGFTAAGSPTWPEAHVFTLGEGEFAESLWGYEGRTLVAFPVDISEYVLPGAYKVEAEVGFQACDDQVCEMPTSIRVSGQTMVRVERYEPRRDPDPAIARLFDAVLGPPATPDEVVFGQGDRMIVKIAWYEGAVVPGRVANLGIVMHVAEGWHVQAGAGSGDVGEGLIPTSFEPLLPEGWTAGAILWPEARPFTIGEGQLARKGAGYDGTTVAVVPVTVPADAVPGDHEVRVRLHFQACDDLSCDKPRDGLAWGNAVVIEPGAADAVPPLDPRLVRQFERTLRRAGAVAVAGADDEAGAAAGAGDDGGSTSGWRVLARLRWWAAMALLWAGMIWMAVRTAAITKRPVPRVVIALLAAIVMYGSFAFVREVTQTHHVWVPYSAAAFDEAQGRGDKTILIKFTADWCANCQVNERIIMADEEARAILGRPDVIPFKVDFTGTNPDGEARKAALGGGGIPLLAVYPPGGGEPVSFRGQLVSADWVVDALSGRVAAADADVQVFDFLGWQFSVKRDAVLLILVLAFIAGFLMNFTPCVLPVIPIKILSLQAHADDPKRCFFLGVIFGLGIIALYAVLGVLMAGLITGVERMDWGQQFEQWWLSGLLGLIVGFMALGMLGLFAMKLPDFLYMFNPQSDTAKGSFFMGVFTAVLSTPCTGPLLGAALAWVITQPSMIAFLTLLVMGVGMAFPYVLLTAKPAWLEKLPRTGPGSELVKQVMGLLLLAVAVYFLGTAVVSFGGSA